MLSILVDLGVFLGGAVGLGAAVRTWRAGPDDKPSPGWWAVGVYILLTLLFFSPALLTRGHQISTDIVYRWLPWKEALAERIQQPKNHLLADPPLQMLPFRELVRRRWLAGEAPLWAHELGTGQPLLANAQSAPFAPLHLAALPLPTLRALTVAAAWQLVLGLLLMHVLLRRLRAPPAGAFLAAVAFAFSTYSVVWAYYPLGMAAMWVPGVLLGLVLVAEGAPRGAAGLVIAGLGLALSGHPETLAHTAVAGSVVALWLWLRGPKVGRARMVLRLAGAAALTFALAAPFLLPILEALPVSERAASLRIMPQDNDPPDFEPGFALWLIDPLVAGSPRDDGWTGSWNFNEQASLYGGFLTLVLAVAGAVVLRGRVLAILLGGLAALLAGFKIDPLHAMVNSAPLLEQGAHGRLRLFWVVAVAIAAGLAVDALSRSRGGRLVFAGLLVTALGLLVWLQTPPALWPRVWWWTTLAGGLVVLAALAALAVLAAPWLLPRPILSERLGRMVIPVVLAAVVLDLFLLGIRYNPVIPPELDLEPTPVQTWLLDRHRESSESRTVEGAVPDLRPFRVQGEGWNLYPNVPAVDGLWNVRGNDPARPMPPSRFVTLRIAGDPFPGRPRQDGKGTHDVAAQEYLGVRYLLTRHRRQWLPAPWTRVYRHQGGRVWENPAALPLFFFPQTVEVSPWSETEARPGGGPILDRVLEIRDFSRLGIVETPDATSLKREASQSGTVRIAALSANRFELAVSSTTGGVVVSSVSHDRGWRGKLDGEPLPLERANTAFLAFRVPPGDHDVRLVYSPDGWRWGWGLCALASIAVLAGLLVRWFRVRQSPAW